MPVRAHAVVLSLPGSDQPTRLSPPAWTSGPRLSTGAPPTDPGYRPELRQPTPFIDRSSCQPTPAIDRSCTNRPRLSTGVVKRHPLLRTWETPTFTHRECCLGGMAVFGRGRVGRGGRFGRGLAAGRERSDRNDAGPRPKRALVGGGARTRVMPGIPLRSMHSLHASSSVRRAPAADGRRSSSSSFSR